MADSGASRPPAPREAKEPPAVPAHKFWAARPRRWLEQGATGPTGEKQRLPEFMFESATLLDRSTALYGPSGSGKTVMVKTIMRALDAHIEQAIIVCPTQPANQSYKGFVDDVLIHTRIWLRDPANPRKTSDPKGAERFLTAIWQRQEALMQTYKRANQVRVLAKLFDRLPEALRRPGRTPIGELRAREKAILAEIRRRYADDPGRLDKEEKSTREKIEKVFVGMYKRFILAGYETLNAREDLSEEEAFALRYISLNPRLLLVLDDCAAELKPLLTKDIFKKFFYQNRHVGVTLVICCQDDTDLGLHLRKNVFNSFYLSPRVATDAFDRLKPTREQKAAFAAMAEAVFRQEERKLVFVREDPARHSYYFAHVPMPVARPFGSAALWELCAEVRASDSALDADNPYASLFRVAQ
jgi:hypothetical protein